MADKELRRLKRRELLQMLLAQCEESERLQKELDETRTKLAALTESYERLKIKLNVKDERLNEKDARIAELNETIEEMRTTKAIELAWKARGRRQQAITNSRQKISVLTEQRGAGGGHG